MIHDAAQGRIPWQQAADAVARSSYLTKVVLERLKPLADNATVRDSGKLYASRTFLQRWRSAHGDAPAIVDPEQSPAKVYALAPFDWRADGEKALFRTLEDAGEAGLAIDSIEGFFALFAEGSPPVSNGAHACRNLLHCTYELGRAAETEDLVRRARQDIVLQMLESGGTAAFVLDGDGWVKSKNKCAQNLLGEILHVATAAAIPAAETKRIGLADILPLARARSSQIAIVTPSARRVMAYAVAWKQTNSIFGSDDELLVAWDMRADAAMFGRWGERETEPFALALRETFGLTRMESILATRLIGSDLRSAAAECGMAYETARSHLKSMFARMNIGSQGERTGLLSRFAYHERLRATLSAG